MTKGQMFRAFVNRYLTAVAEDICALFESTVAEYEEKRCRCKEENQREQQLLGPSLTQEIIATSQNKEEEEQPTSAAALESTDVCVKSEECPVLQHRQTEHMEETQDIRVETEGQTDNDVDWRSQFTDADADFSDQVQTRDRSTSTAKQNSGPKCKYDLETSVTMSNVDIHAGEKSLCCSVCKMTFTRKFNLNVHMMTHTGEKPYSCSLCKKTFSRKSNLNIHKRTHTGDKPFRCSICEKAFTQKVNLEFFILQ
uniref:C2H2-type domain-containing protein n=1 Tax=Neogobius melanostomus TaxID=47308 RepID=A0A8C6SE14_9GOBI